MLRRGLGRLLVRQRAASSGLPVGGGSSSGSGIVAGVGNAGARALVQRLQQQQQTRGFRHHEGGWWEVRLFVAVVDW